MLEKNSLGIGFTFRKMTQSQNAASIKKKTRTLNIGFHSADSDLFSNAHIAEVALTICDVDLSKSSMTSLTVDVRDWQSFSVRGQGVNILVQMVSVTTAHPCCCSPRAAIDNK